MNYCFYLKVFGWLSIFICFLYGSLAYSRSVCDQQCMDKSGQELLFFATTIQKDSFQDGWVLSGNVTVYYKGQVLWADKVYYYPEDERLIAEGNIRLINNKAEDYYAEHLEIKGNFKHVILKHVKVLFSDKSRLAAQEAFYSQDEGLISFKDGAYSLCFPCDKKDTQPFWQVKARFVEKNDKKKKMIYRDAHIQIFGVPVFYAPYLSFATERSSGFLAPHYGTSSLLGGFFSAPYFIAKSHDQLHIEPVFTSKRKIFLLYEYVRNGEQSSLLFKGSGNLSQKLSDENAQNKAHKNRFQGHLFGDFGYDINDKWRLKFKGGFSSDPTYLRTLENLPSIGNDWSLSFLQSYLVLERLTANDAFLVEGFVYQPLRKPEGNEKIPFALPFVTYSYETLPLNLNSYFTFDAHTASIYSFLGDRYQRLITEGKFCLPLQNSLGQRLDFFALLRQDVYRLDALPHESKDFKFHKIKERPFFQMGSEVSWPLRYVDSLLVAAPFLKAVVSRAPNKKKDFLIGGGRGFEYNDHTFLLDNRSPDYDQIDAGSRFVYGSYFFLPNRFLGDVRFVLGQTYELSQPGSFAQYADLRQGFSDIVGFLKIDPFNWCAADYRFRLDRKTLSTRFEELSSFMGSKKFRLGIGYTKMDGKLLPFFHNQTERMMNTSLILSLTDSWMLGVQNNYNLKAKKFLGLRAHILYQNECVKISLNGSRTYYRDKDIKTNNSIRFTINLKNFGSSFEKEPIDFATDSSIFVESGSASIEPSHSLTGTTSSTTSF